MNRFEEPNEDDELDAGAQIEVSKSQKKREAEALRKLGVELIELSESKLSELPLSENLHKAILEAKKIKSHGARRRQAQLIGKLMRAADHEAIQAAWQGMQAEHSAQSAYFHELEHWRDRLIEEEQAALTEFVAIYKPESVQQLRQFVKKAKEDVLLQRNTGAAKALFRYLRSISGTH